MKSSASKHNEVWLGFCGLKLNLPLLPRMNIFALNNFCIWVFAGKCFKKVSETIGFGWLTSRIKRFWFLPPPAPVPPSFFWHQHGPCPWFGPRSERKALREKIFGSKYGSRWLFVIFSPALSFWRELWGSQGCTSPEQIAAFGHKKNPQQTTVSPIFPSSIWIHLPETALSMVFVLSQELSAQHSLHFPNPLFLPGSQQLCRDSGMSCYEGRQQSPTKPPARHEELEVSALLLLCVKCK